MLKFDPNQQIPSIITNISVFSLPVSATRQGSMKINHTELETSTVF